MAKIAFSAAVNDIRGKIGTDVFSRGRSGPTARIRQEGRNPRSTAQSAIRANMAKAAATFKGLTSAQLAQWQAYAQTIVKHNPVTGKSYSLSAINVFTALATKLLQVSPGASITSLRQPRRSLATPSRSQRWALPVRRRSPPPRPTPRTSRPSCSSSR